MRTEIVGIYSYDELSDDAKEKAREYFRHNDYEYAWTDEWNDSINAFCKVMPVERGDYQIGAFYPSYQHCVFTDDDAAELYGVRAYKWLLNNGYNGAFNKYTGEFETAQKIIEGTCPLTGYCGDCDLFYPIAEFMKKPGNRALSELFQDCFDSWLKAYQSDLEYQNSDEYIEESIIANEYEFTKDGKFYG